jgi:hypothetical protein
MNLSSFVFQQHILQLVELWYRKEKNSRKVESNHIMY